MVQKKKGVKEKAKSLEHESNRGEIKDNALKALVTSPLFRTRAERPKKGKGSYNRKGHKLKGDAPYFYLLFANRILYGAC